jgi:hypothetical protein
MFTSLIRIFYSINSVCFIPFYVQRSLEAEINFKLMQSNGLTITTKKVRIQENTASVKTNANFPLLNPVSKRQNNR